jgi:tight adherence protein C
VSALISLSIFLFVTVLYEIINSRIAFHRRLSNTSQDGDLKADDELPPVEHNSSISSLLAALGSLLAPGGGEKEKRLRQTLIRAGYFAKSAVLVFQGVRVLFALILGIGTLLLIATLEQAPPTPVSLIIGAALSAAGMILPAIILDRQIMLSRRRSQAVFPDFIDLFVVCIESGHSLQGAMDRVSREMLQFSREFGTNLRIMNLEMRAGLSLTEALDSLHQRVGIDEIKTLRVLLKQSEELGASIGASLRVYSDEIRDKRLMRAEARAHALPVKLALPLAFFIFPVISMVILIPLVIRIKAAFI